MQVTVPALGDMQFPCTVRRLQALDSYATWKSAKPGRQCDVRSFDVKVVPQSPIEGLRPGMTAVLVERD